MFVKIIFIVCFVVGLSNGYKINITKFENCHEFSNYSVDVLNISYEYDADGLCDIVHGSYTIHSVDLRDYELLTTAYECPTASTEQCDQNPREMVEQMYCDRFHSDNTGPWYMLAQAIKGSRCGEDVGTFEFETAHLKVEYLENYVKLDENNLRHRLRMKFHKFNPEGDDVRACISIDFDIVV